MCNETLSRVKNFLHTLLYRESSKVEVSKVNSYIIDGGRKLEGEIDVSGSKNASLPIIAAAILNKGTTVIKNVPEIRDVRMMCSILESLGCKISKDEGTYN